MSDPPKPTGFPAFLRHAMMLALVAVTSAVAATVAVSLQSEKAPAEQGKHSSHQDDSQYSSEEYPHAVSAVVRDAVSPDVLATRSDRKNAAGKHFTKANETLTPEAVNGQKILPQDDSAFAENTVESHRADSPATTSAISGDDPFSETNLGFSDKEVFPAPLPSRTNDNEPAAEQFVARATAAESRLDAASLHSARRPNNSAGLDSDISVEDDSPFENQDRPKALSDPSSGPVVPGHKALAFQNGARPSAHERVTQQAVNLMADADEELASGNYVQAMQHYQMLRQKSDGVPGTAILFRLALCAEASGRHAAAIEAYRRISGTQMDPAWSGVARYGEARCLSALKKHQGLQTDLLRRILLDETEFLPTVRGEVLHLIGRDLWREQEAVVQRDLLDDTTLVVPEWSADPGKLLDELPLLIHETPVKHGPTEFRVINLKADSPNETVVRLNCGPTKSESLLRNLVQCCDYEIQFSEAAVEALRGRTQQVHVREQSLALLLDGITIPAGIVWQLADSVISLRHPEDIPAEELRQSRLDAAERILRVAIRDVPASPQTGHSRLALSTLLFEQKRAVDALNFLQVQIESAPRSIVESEAAFNLGKCLMMLNQRAEAVQAFLRSIDSPGGLADVRIASYIFHSRILLEDGHGKQAVQSMMRGLSLSEGSALEPFAAIHLASLYLTLGNPQGCNSVLMDRRESLMEGPGREGAAFLSSLSRFRAAVLADRREREGAAVVSALSEFDASKYCGGHWAMLVASACEELGLSRESGEAYSLALRQLPPSKLRNQSVLQLAAHYQADNQLDKARDLLATLSSAESDQLVIQSRLRSAELALEQRKPDEAIVLCRHLIDSASEPPTRRAALRLMGQAFELKKDHQAAIYCFAGMLPETNEIADAAIPETRDAGGPRE